MIYGPIVEYRVTPTGVILWLDQNLTQGIDYNWELTPNRLWGLYFYNGLENITAFKLRFEV